MVRRLKWLLLLILLVQLSGCGRTQKIGISYRNMDTGITARLNDSLAAALKTQTCQVSSVNAVNDQVRQNAQAASLLKEECDLLIVEPVITLEAEAIAQMGQEAGVPVIFLNYAPPKEVLQKYTGVYYIGGDLTSPGEILQEKLKECDPGQYLILSGPEQHMDASLWTKLCCEAIPEKCLGVEYTDGSKESGRRLTARYLARKNDSLETVVCMNDNLTLGALEAVQQAERPVQVIGVGGEKLLFTQAAEDAFDTLVCPDISALTAAVTTATRDCLSGKTPPKETLVPFTVLTKEMTGLK